MRNVIILKFYTYSVSGRSHSGRYRTFLAPLKQSVLFPLSYKKYMCVNGSSEVIGNPAAAALLLLQQHVEDKTLLLPRGG